MEDVRLPGAEAMALAKKIALKTLDFEPAAVALGRASSILRARGLSGPVLERIVNSNGRSAELTVWVLEKGIAGKPGATYGHLSAATKSVGIDHVATASLLASLFECTISIAQETQADPVDLAAPMWASAETAHWLAERHIVPPLEAFSRALFADVGLLAMYFALPEVYSAIARSDVQQPLAQFEKASLGVDHQIVGSMILSELRFPEAVSKFAAQHHGPLLDLGMEDKMVKTACVAVESVNKAATLNTAPEELTEPMLEAVLMKTSDLPELTSAVERFKALASSLEEVRIQEAA